MKFKFLSLLLASGLLFSCSSTRYDSSSSNSAYNVPVGVSTSFTSQYPTATNVVWAPYDVNVVPIDWELNGWAPLTSNDYMVRYDIANDHYYSFYDSDGNWVGSAYALTDYKTLPTSLSAWVQNRYPGYSIESVQDVTWKDNQAYQVKLKDNADHKVKLLVDMNGNVLKEKNKD